MPNHGKCAGEEFAAFSGIGVISSYLLLFISFYIATYKKDGKRPTGRKAARSLFRGDTERRDLLRVLEIEGEEGDPPGECRVPCSSRRISGL